VARDDVTLSYIGQLHEAFTSARAYAGRVLTLMLLVSLLIIATAVETSEEARARIAGLEVATWALMLGGSLYLVAAPGVAIGRMLRMRLLSERITSLYAELDEEFRSRVHLDEVDPYDMPGIVAEATLAARRWEGGTDTGWSRVADGIGRIAVGAVIGGFPVVAQMAAAYWWSEQDVSLWLFVPVSAAVVGTTLLSIWVAWDRWGRPGLPRKHHLASS
jgi:hypothetical protein